jgi:hypothetical protein
MKNLTHEEMFNSDKCKYLWSKIRVIDEKKMVFRDFFNPMDKGWKLNLKKYLSKSVN